MYILHALGSSLDKGSSSLELEFDKYSLPLYYPKEQEVYSFAEFLSKSDDADPNCIPADDVKHLMKPPNNMSLKANRLKVE